MNYFINQYIKMGVFVGGAGLELVNEEEGKKAVASLDLAKRALAANKPRNSRSRPCNAQL